MKILEETTAGGAAYQPSVKQPRTLPTLTILYHPDLSRIGERHYLSAPQTRLSRAEPVFVRESGKPGAPLADPFMSRKPFLLQREGDAVQLRLENTRTALRVNGEPCDHDRHFNQLEQGVLLTFAERVVVLLHISEPPSSSDDDDLGIIGDAPEIRRVREDICAVADLDVPVLIRGETGSGKELVAQAVHRLNRRGRRPLTTVNLGALVPNLAAAELFGSTRGAFTGADRERSGYFRKAHGGALFLDEVGEASPEIQVALLRALETSEITPVGAPQAIKIDIRLIAATDARLETMIEEGQFREPLLHRLAGYQIWLPPLRERRDDQGRLLRHFLVREANELGCQARLRLDDPHDEPWLPAHLAERLFLHPWPGNVRQFKNLVRQLAIAGRRKQQIPTTRQIEQLLARPEPTAAGGPTSGGPTPARRKPADIDEAELHQAMRTHDWEPAAAAHALGISRTSMYALIRDCPALRTAGDVSADEITRTHAANNGDLTATAQTLEVSKKALRRRLGELGLH